MSAKVGAVEPQHMDEGPRVEVWASNRGVELHLAGNVQQWGPVRARAFAALVVQAAGECEGMRRRPSDDAFEGVDGDAGRWEQLARNWCDTAAQHCRNEEYYRERAEKAETELTEIKVRPAAYGRSHLAQPPEPPLSPPGDALTESAIKSVAQMMRNIASRK
jgi:hypothetical protein